jgi:uncharacterized membrane protein (UPF0127 family)
MKLAKGIRNYTGLMFRTRKTEPLLFEFDKPVYIPIHSWFVFFSFLVEWTLEDGTVESRWIKPFTSKIYPSKPFTKLLETPL